MGEGIAAGRNLDQSGILFAEQGILRKNVRRNPYEGKDGCISCGACVAACPEVFRFNDDGVAEAFADVAPEYEKPATEARDGCPVSVIDIEE